MNTESSSKRIYTTYGKKTLEASEPWTPVESPAKGWWRFFKVGVEMVAVLRTATSGQRGRLAGDIRTAGAAGFASDGDRSGLQGRRSVMGGLLSLQGCVVVLNCGALRREVCLRYGYEA